MQKKAPSPKTAGFRGASPKKNWFDSPKHRRYDYDILACGRKQQCLKNTLIQKPHPSKEIWAILKGLSKDRQKMAKEIARSRKDLDRRVKDTDRQLKDASQMIKELSRQPTKIPERH